MRALVRYIRFVDALNGAMGAAASWALIPVVAIAFTVVVLRYVFSIGFPWLQELYIWTHGVAFMLAAAWVLRDGGHVRVDLLYRKLSRRGRAWIDFLGYWLFLVPMVCVLGLRSWPVVERSWHIAERSQTADGLSGLFILKSALIVFCALLLLQGLAEALRALAVLLGREAALPPATSRGSEA